MSEVQSCATHLALLTRLAMQTHKEWPDETTAELGCGYYSTHVLARMADLTGRTHHVYTTDVGWGSRFRDMASVHYIDDWDTFTLPEGHRLVLQDSEEREGKRGKRIEMLLDRARVVVVHDANHRDLWPILEQTEARWTEVDRTYQKWWTWAGSNQGGL